LQKRRKQPERYAQSGQLVDKNIKKIVYGTTAHNRSVYASPPVGGSGFRFARSAAPPTLHYTHILPALVLLRKPLYRLAKRRKQPERYVQCWLKFVV
jgi:hypothetical protein